QALINRYPTLVQWYYLIKNNTLSEQQLEDASNATYIGALEWWLALTTKRPDSAKFSEAFLTKHKDKKNWWKFIPMERRTQFFEQCLEAVYPTSSSRNHLAVFLNEFVEQ